MSGCMRHVWSRKTPRDGSTVADSPRRWPRAETSAPGGWTPWIGWSSWRGSPSRTRLPRRLADGEGVREAHLSRLVDDEGVDRAGHLIARPQPRGARSKVHLAGGEGVGHLVVGGRPGRSVRRGSRRCRSPSGSRAPRPALAVPACRPIRLRSGRSRPAVRRPRRTRPRAGWRSPCGCWRSPRLASR